MFKTYDFIVFNVNLLSFECLLHSDLAGIILCPSLELIKYRNCLRSFRMRYHYVQCIEFTIYTIILNNNQNLRILKDFFITAKYIALYKIYNLNASANVTNDLLIYD